MNKGKAIKRAVDFFGNQLHDIEGRLSYVTEDYEIIFLPNSSLKEYILIDEKIDFEIIKRLNK